MANKVTFTAQDRMELSIAVRNSVSSMDESEWGSYGVHSYIAGKLMSALTGVTSEGAKCEAVSDYTILLWANNGDALGEMLYNDIVESNFNLGYERVSVAIYSISNIIGAFLGTIDELNGC